MLEVGKKNTMKSAFILKLKQELKNGLWTLTFPHPKKIDGRMFNGATAVLNTT